MLFIRIIYEVLKDQKAQVSFPMQELSPADPGWTRGLSDADLWGGVASEGVDPTVRVQDLGLQTILCFTPGKCFLSLGVRALFSIS